MGVMCLAQEHNTMSPARGSTRTVRSGGKRTKPAAIAAITTFSKLLGFQMLLVPFFFATLKSNEDIL